MGDAATAGANGVNVDHRDQNRIAGYPGIAGSGFAELPVRHHANISAGAAHIKGNESAALRPLARPGSTEYARGRAGQEGQGGFLRDHPWRGESAVGANNTQLCPNPCGA